MDKISINIVYSPQTDPPHKVYENEKGEVWHSRDYDSHKINVGMGWYSLRNPRPQDSLLVVEPFCILERDYDTNFLSKFKNVFTWATKAMSSESIKDKVVAINHPTYHSFPDMETVFNGLPTWEERKNEIVIIANNKSSHHYSELYSLRVHLADVLSASSSFKVSWYGQIPLNKPYYCGKAENKLDLLKNAKFSLCTENSHDNIHTHNYFTEKMPDTWLAGTVPLYMGCFNIDEFCNADKHYIDLRKFVSKHNKSWSVNKTELNNQITNFNTEQYQTYLNDVKNDLLVSGKLQQYHSYNKVYDVIIDTFLNQNNA